jgi:hypothetical protein
MVQFGLISIQSGVAEVVINTKKKMRIKLSQPTATLQTRQIKMESKEG